MIKRGIFTILIILALVLSGCQAFEERFMTEEVDDHLIPNDTLAEPATRENHFTMPEEITLKRGGKTTLEVGFYNDLPTKVMLLVAGPDANIGFGTASNKNTVICENEKEYEYTLEFESPLPTIELREATGVEVIINDKNSIATDKIVCPVSALNVEAGKLIETKELIINIVD